MKYKFIALILWIFMSSAYSAGIDCAKAKSGNEKAICSVESLSKLDKDLHKEYQILLKIYSGLLPINEWHRIWLRSFDLYCDVYQNSIKLPDPDIKCLEKAYKKRIDLFKAARLVDEPAKSWTGYYVANSYHGKTLTKSAEIILIGLSKQRVYVVGTAINTIRGTTDEMEGYGMIKNNILRGEDEKILCGAEFTLRKDGSLKIENESLLLCGGQGISFDDNYTKQ